MPNRCLLVLLCCFAPAALAQSQYGPPAAPQNSPPASAQSLAKSGCPWITEGTAATALGGDVTAAINVSDTGEGSCKFSRPASPDSVEVLVSKAALPTCPAGSMELRGIGNEAERCSHPASRGQAIEMISSRVRDLFFSVTLSCAQKAMKTADPQNDALEQIAEQVAGNLY